MKNKSCLNENRYRLVQACTTVRRNASTSVPAHPFLLVFFEYVMQPDVQ